ncbi:expressed unknown protein [Seminavis robusta]|uniref:Uncharacterized protein n=1 Tax=Seminavis robusta TaxID=568900 RepID=A0A9N8E0P8_9STRA|nr:expressed unknown protein [Seminavis robusta]|eukprot:Sro433_g141850.1 n/a (140) ;mRNA; f:42157-42576
MIRPTKQLEMMDAFLLQLPLRLSNCALVNDSPAGHAEDFQILCRERDEPERIICPPKKQRPQKRRKPRSFEKRIVKGQQEPTRGREVDECRWSGQSSSSPERDNNGHKKKAPVPPRQPTRSVSPMRIPSRQKKSKSFSQ